jgi:hypothetical protein
MIESILLIDEERFDCLDIEGRTFEGQMTSWFQPALSSTADDFR